MSFLGLTSPSSSRDLPRKYQPASSANPTCTPRGFLKKTATTRMTTSAHGFMDSADTTIQHVRPKYENRRCTITRRCEQAHFSILKYILPPGNTCTKGKSSVPTALVPLPHVAGAHSAYRGASIVETPALHTP